MNTGKATKIDALTATRGFAALMVVIFHFGTQVYPISIFENFFTAGNIAVSYFFVLSGFVMYYTYAEKEIAYKEYLKRRIARIYPIYVFALLLTILPSLYNHFTKGVTMEHGFMVKLLLHLSFLQSYIPGYVLTLNGPGWSLSVEMLFYLLFPIVVAYSVTRKAGFIRFVILFWVLSQAVHLALLKTVHNSPFSKWHDLIFYNPILHLNQFLVGMAGAMVFVKGNFKTGRLQSLFWFVVIVLLINYFPRSISIHNGLLAPTFLLFILSLAARQPKWLCSKPLVFLGEVSYGIYILQIPVYYYVSVVNAHKLDLNGIAFFSIYVFTLIVVSSLSYYLIEQPLRKAINRINI